MQTLVPYLFFNGNCREAMNFYKDCFGGKLELMTYAEAPDEGSCAEGDGQSAKMSAQDKIMHGCLTRDNFTLMASDNPMGAPIAGDNVSISVHCETVPQTQKLFSALGEGGQITMPLTDTFWGAHFGMLIDRFGFRWMLNCPLKK